MSISDFLSSWIHENITHNLTGEFGEERVNYLPIQFTQSKTTKFNSVNFPGQRRYITVADAHQISQIYWLHALDSYSSQKWRSPEWLISEMVESSLRVQVHGVFHQRAHFGLDEAPPEYQRPTHTLNVVFIEDFMWFLCILHLAIITVNPETRLVKPDDTLPLLYCLVLVKFHPLKLLLSKFGSGVSIGIFLGGLLQLFMS